MRIATSYPATVSRYLAAHGITATCIPITGSVELAPSLDASEAIADLVSSGETLRQNGLVELETILESEAVLLAPPGSTRPPGSASPSWCWCSLRARRAPEAVPDAERATTTS